jgi:fermentation-respiration switch protein FrsA (DUF1100 family)
LSGQLQIPAALNPKKMIPNPDNYEGHGPGSEENKGLPTPGVKPKF